MRDYLPWVGGGADRTHGRKCVKVTMVDISDMIRNREIIGTKRYLEKYQKIKKQVLKMQGLWEKPRKVY